MDHLVARMRSFRRVTALLGGPYSKFEYRYGLPRQGNSTPLLFQP